MLKRHQLYQRYPPKFGCEPGPTTLVIAHPLQHHNVFHENKNKNAVQGNPCECKKHCFIVACLEILDRRCANAKTARHIES